MGKHEKYQRREHRLPPQKAVLVKELSETQRENVRTRLEQDFRQQAMGHVKGHPNKVVVLQSRLWFFINANTLSQKHTRISEALNKLRFMTRSLSVVNYEPNEIDFFPEKTALESQRLLEISIAVGILFLIHQFHVPQEWVSAEGGT